MPRSSAWRLGVIGLLAGCLGPARAGEIPARWRGHLAPGVQHYEWRELDDNGARMLKESGWIYLVDGGLERSVLAHGLTRMRGELFGGQVSYDGRRMDFTDYQSQTLYMGAKLEADGAWSWNPWENASLLPMAGMGGRVWKRRLDASRTDDQGYDENWVSLYAILGLRGELRVKPGWTAFAECAVRRPFYNHETVYLSVAEGRSNLEFEPGCEPSWFVEGGLRAGAYRWSVFYEQLRYAKSDYELKAFYQPKSEADMIGLACGMAF